MPLYCAASRSPEDEVVTDVLTSAVYNNVAWCASMCRVHGITSTYDDDVWASHRPSPRWFPDAVCLRPAVAADTVVAALTPRRHASVKDCFADVDLSGHGFERLFEARWIAAPPASTGEGAAWSIVRGTEELNVWGASGVGEVIVPALLNDPTVTVVAEFDGAVLNLAADVVGVSNVFDTAGVSVATWRAVASTAATVWPGTPLVGYEADDDAAAACTAGFTDVGVLRVWAR